MRGFRNALEYLYETCPMMRYGFATYGRPKSRKRAPGFPTLVRIIIDQQVSVQAGAAIWARLLGTVGDVAPQSILSAGFDGLRASGLSGAKARYVIGIAEAIRAGELKLNALSRKSDEDVRIELTKLKGIGAWTADIYLMFALGRPDVLPIGDIALQAAAGRLAGWTKRPSPSELLEIGEAWRPHRTTAAVALWHFYKKLPAQG